MGEGRGWLGGCNNKLSYYVKQLPIIIFEQCTHSTFIKSTIACLIKYHTHCAVIHPNHKE